MSAFRRCCLFLPLLSLMAFTQTVTSSVNGVFTDATGAVVPGVTATLTARDTGAVFRAQSGGDGSFIFNSVPAGAYALKAEGDGFQSLEVSNVMVSISEVRSLGNLKLSVGAVGERIVVTAEAAAVQLSSGEKSGVLTADQIDKIAVKGRDFMALLTTIPGVVDTMADSRDASSLGAARGIHINGGAQNAKSITVDGHDILDIGNNTELQFQPNMDSIAEIKVLTSNYQAAFGRKSGGVISVITKSGTQAFHGTGYYFWRHESMNANDFFRNRTGTEKAPYRYRIGGFSLGGPAYIPGKFNSGKDKLFFFVSQELVRRREDYGTRFVNSPTALERAGDFSQSFDLNGRLIPIRDPSTNAAFPGNRIPTNRIDPNGQAILNFFPLPNYTDPNPSLLYQRNYRSTFSGGHPRNDTNIRLDANLWPSFRVYYRFVRDTEEQTTPFGIWQANPTNYDLDPLQFSHPSTSHLVHMTKIFSPTTIAEFSFNTNFTEYIFDRPVDRSRMGNPPRWYTPDSSVANYIPDIQFGAQPVNSIQVGINNSPFYNYIRPYIFSGNLTHIRGQHNIQTGLYVERSNQYLGATFGATGGGVQSRGVYNFARNVNNPFDTNHGFSNALLGYYNTYTEATARPDGDYWFWDIEYFAQDTWKVTSRLTLDLGVRFYHQPPEQDLNRHMVDFNPGLYDPNQAPAMYVPALDANRRRVAMDPVGGALAPATLIGRFVPGTGNPANGAGVGGVNGYPGGQFTWPSLSVTPRFGFAYDLFGNGNTAIRGGFGTYVDRISGNVNRASGPPIVSVPTQFYGQISQLQTSSGVLGPAAFSSLNASPIDHPNTMNFSLGVQHRLLSAVAEVSYVGSLSRHGIVNKDINAIPLGARFDPANADPTMSGTPLSDDFLRPYRGWGAITSKQSIGTSNYHSMQVSVNRRFTRGLQFGVAYSWSRVLGIASTQSADVVDDVVSPYFAHRSWDYGLMPWDRTHVFNLNYLYEIPDVGSKLGFALARWALNDWELSGVTQWTSGTPFTPGFTTTDGQDITGSSEAARISVTGDPYLPSSERTFERNFRTEAFARTPRGSFGNAGMGLLRGPGISNWDISIGKRFPIFGEGRFLRFRAEFYNAFNHTQFSDIFSTARFDPAGNQVDPNFGSFSAARRPRTIQLSARFVF